MPVILENLQEHLFVLDELYKENPIWHINNITIFKIIKHTYYKGTFYYSFNATITVSKSVEKYKLKSFKRIKCRESPTLLSPCIS
jgi:hypothetical protein